MNIESHRFGQDSAEPGPSPTTRSYGERHINSRIILFVTNTEGFGGTEKHLLELISRLPQPEVQPILMQVGIPAYSDHLKGSGHFPVTIRSEKFRNSLWNWFRFFRRNRAEVTVFVNGWVRSFPWYASLAAFLAGVPKRFGIQHLVAEPLDKVEGRSIGSILRRILGGRARTRIVSSVSTFFLDKTICVSDAVRNRLVTDYRFPLDKTITIHNGVSISEFAPSENNRTSMRKRLGIGPQEITFVCTARLSKVKGLHILLRAVVRVLRTGLRCKFIIVGDGPLRKELVDEAEALGLKDHVIFEGFHRDVRPYLQAADVFVLTSYWEGFPLSILEAMACGLPCVVTDVGGNSEAVHDKIHGLVIAAGSVGQAADAISFMVIHPKERAEMAEKARVRVQQEFDIEARMEEIVRLILN